ncbi:fungal-specific transcription factor domain-containing protein [Calycina marina]|uniref:Fungal-specific transcription factor domain-containing protein n=1 Tax=Calycina marina TaxID=1763456 RepID=A0A9P8CJ49_9HELO|nr:fungal-specific transcription factor domain-containing protein [Calycina marina]
MEGTTSNNSRRVPLDKRKRTETSCDKCKSRKQKCDRQSNEAQCRYCEINKIPCRTTQVRKKRIYGSEQAIGSRIALLESLVKGLLPEADLSSNEEMQQLGKSLGIPLPAIEDFYGEMDKSGSKTDDEYALPLMPDQQGQAQYTGPRSSFRFHLDLRRLIGNYHEEEFAMFGRNAAETDYMSNTYPEPSALRMVDVKSSTAMVSTNGTDDTDTPYDTVRKIDGAVLNSLIDAYFDIIHSDFLVLHEPSFREAYENFCSSSSGTDPAWLCTLLCVLILACRVAPISIPDEMEKKWWGHVRNLLPTIMFTSNLLSVQAILLVALHLHNTSHRDACWNITGVAVRIAFAIGLHRDDIQSIQSPLSRELRKQLWWTLYAFEQFQVSSYDRPSGIEHTVSLVGSPNERIVGGHGPQGFTMWSQRLALLLGSACRALNPSQRGSTGVEDAYSKPLSPASGVLRDLNRWREALPPHLRLEITGSLAPSTQRQVLLLHAQYYYIICMITRAALLRRATIIWTNSSKPIPPILCTISDTCTNSGIALGDIMLKLEAIDRFNALTWFDTFYTVTAALVLILDVIVKRKVSSTQSLQQLSSLEGLAERHLQNPRVPGTMHKLSTIVVELSTLANNLPHQAPPGKHDYDTMSFEESSPDGKDSMLGLAQLGNVYMGDERMVRENSSQFWSQFSQDNTELQDWCWDEIGQVLQTNSST